MYGSRKSICRYFQAGFCRYGQDCSFSHDVQPALPAVCRFFLAGTCAYGDACRFTHPEPELDHEQEEDVYEAHEQLDPVLNLPDDVSDPFCFGGDREEDAWDEEDDIWEEHYEQYDEWDAPDCSEQQHAACSSAGIDHTSTTPNHGEGAGVSHSEEGNHHEYSEHARGWMPGETSTDMADPADLPLCSHFTVAGACPSGDACHLIHGEQCETCGRYSVHPYNPDEAEQHRQECRRRHDRLAARLRSSQIECGICLEKVLAKPHAADRRFGLLACDHPFCLSCIRNWRSHGTADIDTAVRTCPVCRTATHFVVPSTVWPESPEERDAIQAGYKGKLGTIHCRHFAQGAGTCPFGTSCFYRHVHPDGREEPKDPLLLRRYMDQEGEVRIVSGVSLADFLDTPQARRMLAGRGRSRGIA